MENGAFTDPFESWDARIYRITTDTDPSSFAYGYPVTNDLINTGSFLGYLYVREAPWNFSYTTANWWYIPDPASDLSGEPGAWVYMPGF